jgi:preprotein translocase subunit SecE
MSTNSTVNPNATSSNVNSMETATDLNAKFVTVGFLGAGVLVGIGASVLFEAGAAIATGRLGQFFGNETVSHGLPVLLGLLTFAALQMRPDAKIWGDEVVTELRRVVWPSRPDTTRMTIFVCVMLLLSGAALGLLDVVSGTLVEWLLKQNIFGSL